MLEYHRDDAATKTAYKSKRFRDRRSWISIGGHQYLRGKDRSALREKVFRKHAKNCRLCGVRLREGEGDIDHIEGKRPKMRCDCWGTRLADGTRHTNVRRTCSMWAIDSCHAEKHHRVLRSGKA